MSKFLQRNISELNKLKRNSTQNANNATKKRVDEIIKLYTERKLSNVATAENYIKGLTSTDKKVYDKAVQKYKDNSKKIKDTKPLNERMAEAKAKNEEEDEAGIKQYRKPKGNELSARYKTKTYFIQFMLYTAREESKRTKIKSKPAFKRRLMNFCTKTYDNFNITIQARTISTDIIRKRIFQYLGNSDIQCGRNSDTPKNEFYDTLNLLTTDEDFNEVYREMTEFYNDIECVKILSVERMNKNGEKFNILTENLRDATNVSMHHKYLHTPIKMSEGTIQKAIKKGNYIENECWINSLTDFYSDTIMNERTRNRLTRENIIEIIGRENFSETGATITEMEAVFKKFSIQVRIFNFVNEVIYKYEPEKRNHHIKTFYTMGKNNHIYTLNHDLSKIQQKQLITKLPTIKAHTDYYINEREEPPQYKMIKCIDDILKI